MFRTALFLFFIVWLTSAYAINLDSLWGVWNDSTQPDTNRLNAIQNIAWDVYYKTQPDSTYYFAQIQYEFAKSVGNKKYISTALHMQAAVYTDHGNIEKALDYYNRSLKKISTTL